MPLSDKTIMNDALTVVNDAFVGVMTTIDEQGSPMSRWMGATTFDQGLACIYTLTGSTTRKVAQIENNPQVCWVFSAPHHRRVVTLYGKASRVEVREVPQHIFENLAECAQAYAMNALSNPDNLEFVLIATYVEKLEYLSPADGVFTPRALTIG